MPEGRGPLAVAWWHARHGGIASWLLVGPPPAPLTGGAWLHQLAVSQGPGAWAVASQPSLGPLPDRIAEALQDPFGAPGDARSAVLRADGERLPGDAAGELRAGCLESALELVARRLAEPIEPRESGVLLLRLRTDGSRLHLDIAPAIDEDGWLGRAVLVDLRRAVLRWNGGGSAPLERVGETFAEGTAALGSARLELPFASLELAVPDAAMSAGGLRAAVDVTLPTLWHSEVPEPVVTLKLEAQ